MSDSLRSVVVSRRLLLAKEFYRNAVDQSKLRGGLNGLLAIHNFHIAIEIVLKAILLENEIRSEKTLNIDFERMLADIDAFPAFKEVGKILPFRQELRNINQQRNLAQHHAVEPHADALAEVRYVSYRFLVDVFDRYFDCSFDEISRVDLIQYPTQRRLVLKALALLAKERYLDSSCCSSAAFVLAQSMLTSALPGGGQNALFFASTDLKRIDETGRLERVFGKVYGKIHESELFSAVLASGVSLAELSRFQKSTPRTDFSLTGKPWFHVWNAEVNREMAQNAIDFVIDCVIKWQLQGLELQVSDERLGDLLKYIEEDSEEGLP